MLVLTRRPGEVVNLYTKDGIKLRVAVLKVHKDPFDAPTVRLGFDAPKDISIVREEIDDNEGTVR